MLVCVHILKLDPDVHRVSIKPHHIGPTTFNFPALRWHHLTDSRGTTLAQSQSEKFGGKAGTFAHLATPPSTHATFCL